MARLYPYPAGNMLGVESYLCQQLTHPVPWPAPTGLNFQ